MSDKKFKISMDVRDYECDMADGVNNAVYMNYLEHARLCALKSGGVDYAELARKKIGLVTTHVDARYLCSLISGDSFVITTEINRVSRLRYEFIQEIRRTKDDKLVLQAKVQGTSINEKGKPSISKELEGKLISICANI